MLFCRHISLNINQALTFCSSCILFLFAGVLVFQMITDLAPDSPYTFLETPPSEAYKDAENSHMLV